MKFYQEITLIPDDDIAPYFLWSKVYTQIHIALVDNNNPQIGVGFPQYRFDKKWATLGLKLRVFAQTEQELSTLNLAKWLERLSDYLHLKSVQPVPKHHRHATFKRYHTKNLHKVAQEFADFKGIDFDTALAHCKTHKAQPENHPFIELISQTTGQKFRLYIAKETVSQAINDKFSSYGLAGGSVPDF